MFCKEIGMKRSTPAIGPATNTLKNVFDDRGGRNLILFIARQDALMIRAQDMIAAQSFANAFDSLNSDKFV